MGGSTRGYQGGVMLKITQNMTASHPNAPEFDLDA